MVMMVLNGDVDRMVYIESSKNLVVGFEFDRCVNINIVYIWPNEIIYLTNLIFPEIRVFPFQNATFWGPRSCEVAII